MQNATVLTNGGQNVFYRTEPRELEIAALEGIKKISVEYGWVNLSPDFQIQFGGELALPLTEEEARRISAELGLRFEIDDPRKRAVSIRNEKGELRCNINSLIAMMGYGPEASEWEHSNGCVFMLTRGRRNPHFPPIFEDSVSLEAHNVIEKARKYIHENFRSFKRNVKLDVYKTVRFWCFASSDHVEVIRVKVGDSIEIEKAGNSYFGSGLAWGSWEVFGSVTEKVTATQDTGFVINKTIRVTFSNGPAAIFTACGDGINGGRKFYRKLYVAE